ncbi:hypothetical protein Ddc_11669 [Ditylenchus destructor]|nr:hypothetical protein Ddc_11669 [Ditylenchus destructor]
MNKISPLLIWIFVFVLVINLVLVSAKPNSRKQRERKERARLSQDAGPDGPDAKYSSTGSSIEWGPAINGLPDGDFGEDGDPDHPYFTHPKHALPETLHGPLMGNGDPHPLLMKHLREDGPLREDDPHALDFITPNTSKASSTESHGPSMPDDVKPAVKSYETVRREAPGKELRRKNQEKIVSLKKEGEGNNPKNGGDAKLSKKDKRKLKKQKRRELNKMPAKDAQEK